jgi:beta-galactosidase
MKTVIVPAEWNGKRILLRQRRHVTEMEVYTEDRLLGSFDYLRDYLDVTDAFKPGNTLPISLFIPDDFGVSGDLYLEALPPGGGIRSVQISTSVENKRLSLKAVLQDTRDIRGVSFTAEICKAGKPVKTFTGSALDGIIEDDAVNLSWEWPDPELWDIGAPNLYTLRLLAEGPDIRDRYDQQFGFREIKTAGKYFYLNGRKINFRPVNGTAASDPLLVEKQIDNFISQGFNLIEMWPQKKNNAAWKIWYEIADRKGVGVTGALGNMWHYLNDWDQGGKSRFERLMTAELERVMNHPSILLWGTNGNVFGSGLGMDPRSLGIRKDRWYDCFYWRKRRVPRGEEGFALLKKRDPSRPVFAHHGGGIADVFTLNMYLNMTPLQEREEWLSFWVQESSMPLMIVEFGTPVHAALTRGRTDYPNAIHSEPWVTEFAAVYFGREAYRLETGTYRQALEDHYINDQRYRSWHGADEINKDPLFQKLQELFIRNTWRSWRTWGISGGMVPWHLRGTWGKVDNPEGEVFPERENRKITREEYHYLDSREGRLLPAGAALRRYNGSVLFWVAGKEDHFTEKGHNFIPGEILEKQIIFLNDLREKAEIVCSWKIRIGDETAASCEVRGNAEPGEKFSTPVRFPLPELSGAERVSGVLAAEGRINGVTCFDSFRFTVFQPVQSRMGSAGGADSPGVLLIRSGKLGQDDGPGLNALEEYVERGGRAVIFGQPPDVLREEFGFRVCRHVSRSVFPVAPDHPIMNNLMEEDLRDFRGAGTSIPAKPEYLPGKTKLGKWWFPYYGYHWGNTGSVSSGAVEKPHTSSWTPVLECEFDLAYTPLMELSYGKGLLLLCTIDLENRTEGDPAADILYDNIVRYAAEKTPVRKGKVVLLGDKTDEKKLASLGVEYQVAEEIDKDAVLHIIGGKTGWSTRELIGYAEQGGNVFFLPGSAGHSSFGLEARRIPSYRSSLTIPDWEECAGLSLSDIRSRTDRPGTVFSGNAELGLDGRIARKKFGIGSIIFSTVDPDMLQADENTCLRFTRWRETRLISQILGNMGAIFRSDRLIFRPVPEEKVSLSGEWEMSLEGRNWKKVLLPSLQYLDGTGDVYFRKTLPIPEAFGGRDLFLSLGKIDGSDETFFNGVCVSGGEQEAAWPHNYPRIYRIPEHRVKQQNNEICVRLYGRDRKFDTMGEGGFAGPAEDMYIKAVRTEGDTGYYHPDYREDYILGDDPCRYFNF